MNSINWVKQIVPFIIISGLLLILTVVLYTIFGYARINVSDKDAVVFINNKIFTQSETGMIKVRPGEYSIKIVSPTKDYIDTKKLLPFSSTTITTNKIEDYSPIFDTALNSTSYEYTNINLSDNKWLTACASNRESGVIVALYFDNGLWLPVAITDTEKPNTVLNLRTVLPQDVFTKVNGCQR